MILAPHMLAGAAVASKIHQPWIGLPLALATHFLLDALPHRDYSVVGLTKPGTRNFPRSAAKVLLDLTAGMALIVLGIPSPADFAYIAAAAGLGILPDLLLMLSWFEPPSKNKKTLYYIWSMNQKLAAFHERIHQKEKPPKALGWGLQIILTLAFIFILTLP